MHKQTHYWPPITLINISSLQTTTANLLTMINNFVGNNTFKTDEQLPIFINSEVYFIYGVEIVEIYTIKNKIIVQEVKNATEPNEDINFYTLHQKIPRRSNFHGMELVGVSMV